MHKLIFFVLIITLSGLTGCTTGAERAAEADADFKEERLKILRKYQECVDQHKGNAKMLESCEHYLKAIDAMK
jgi:arginyl-tRNA--protein-N-Asp/Glu arginylyltransferase